MATPQRQEYPAMLSQVQPPQAVGILNDRIQQVGRLNNAIADWLKERRRLEEQYSSGLRTLAQRRLDGVDLGIFAGPWTTLTGSVDTLADSHSTLATKIEVDVERPLRDFSSSNREMSALSTMQGNLGELAKEVDRAQQKTDKLRGKGERGESGKIANATSDLDTAQAQWDSQAPYVFESLQSLDEARLNHLRDALTQYQTHEMDQVERNRVSGEQCLNVLLNVETADEIKAFAIRAPQAKLSLARAQRSSVAYATPSRTLTPGASNSLAQTTSRSEDDLTRERQGSTDEKAKGRAKGGLRRLGTVLGRRRESKTPATDSPESRPKPSSMNSFGNRFGRSRDNASGLETMQETSPRQRPSMPTQVGSELFSPPSEVRADPNTPPSTSRDLGSISQVNGTAYPASPEPTPSTVVSDSHQNDMSDLDPPRPVWTERKESLRALEGQKDSEGYSMPSENVDPITQAQQEAALSEDGSSPALNVNIRNAPIQEDAVADSDLASVANRLGAPPPATKRTSTIRGRRTDRNSFVNNAFTPLGQTISESNNQAASSAARDISDASPFDATPTSPARDVSDAPPFDAAPASAARDVSDPPPFDVASPTEQPNNVTATGLTMSPSSTFGPASQLSASTFSPFSPQSDQQSPLRSESRATGSESRATGSVDQGRIDSQSIRSATTSASQGGNKHPDFTDTGLNASIVETLSARFEKSTITSVSLMGEVALAYNPADFSSPFGNEHIRLENFSNLEKVAPNPAFIQSIPDKSGEYSVDLSSIAKTQIAFKYQIRLEDDNTLAPILIKPALKIESNQCSIIVSYSLNPAFNLHGQDAITLSNVMLALTIEGTTATSCQSKPGGTFSRERSLIYWQLNEIKLVAGAAAEKLLARFATESEATGASVEAKWELTGENVGSALSVSSQSSGGAGDGSDPFADEDGQGAGGWKPVRAVRKLVSGSYVVK